MYCVERLAGAQNRNPKQLASQKAALFVSLIWLLYTDFYSSGATGYARNSSIESAAQIPLVNFVDMAPAAGLNAFVVYGNDRVKKYILETTGTGVAWIDYDNDDWPDIFVVNGTTFEGFTKGKEPHSYLFKNNRDGTFTDVSEKAGFLKTGWGQGVCAGDYNNDGFTDLYVTYYGHDVLYHNNGDGTFTDVTKKAGLEQAAVRWGTGCSFLDYDLDGRLDLFVANYVDFDPQTVPTPGTNRYCQWKGTPVMCGPRGLKGGTNILYHNNGDGTFTDVSVPAKITNPSGYYAFTAVTLDYDNDRFPDIYIACDSTPSILYHNNGDGTFTDVGARSGTAYNEDGREQAGMGADAGDFNGDGFLDLVKTNFMDDTSTLYQNNGDGTFADRTAPSGIGVNKKYLGWGVAFTDVDNDSWPDIFMANGHVYPEIQGLGLKDKYRQGKLVYWNNGRGGFQDISARAGEAISAPKSSRGIALADYDHDGVEEILVSNMEDRPQLLKNVGKTKNWLSVAVVGTRSNYNGIGAKIAVITGSRRQIKEVRSGGHYLSQSDFRQHFGVGDATRIERIEILWPSGIKDLITDVSVNQLITVKEGKGLESKKK